MEPAPSGPARICGGIELLSMDGHAGESYHPRVRLDAAVPDALATACQTVNRRPKGILEIGVPLKCAGDRKKIRIRGRCNGHSLDVLASKQKIEPGDWGDCLKRGGYTARRSFAGAVACRPLA